MKALVPTGKLNGMVTFADVGEPVLRPNEAMIAVEAFSTNRDETFLLERPAEGWRPGKDVAGRIVTAAADGSGWPIGIRVVAHPPAGGWAERVAVDTGREAAAQSVARHATAHRRPPRSTHPRQVNLMSLITYRQ